MQKSIVDRVPSTAVKAEAKWFYPFGQVNADTQGFEFEFNRFLNDDGRPRAFSQMDRRNEEGQRFERILAASKHGF